MSHEEVSTKTLSVTRRSVLLGGAAIFGSYLFGPALPSFALPAPDETKLSRFMQLSRLLINHQLDPRVGARILKTTEKERADLDSLSDSIIAIAHEKQASIVEDFFDDVPAGPAREFAYWVIFAWYTGQSSPKPNAEVFTFEQALSYQTTIDVVAIPSYGITGPNKWSQVTVPLSPLPRF